MNAETPRHGVRDPSFCERYGYMKILHVIAGLARSGGGLSELVPVFAREAAKQGHDVTLATVARKGDVLSEATEMAVASGVRVVRFDPSPPRFLYFSRAMLRGLRLLVAGADVVHVHSNWTFPVWWACHLARKHGIPLVMSPQGCLDPVRLSHSAWKKRLAGVLDRHYLRRADVVQATCVAEAGWIKAFLKCGNSEGQKLDDGATIGNRQPEKGSDQTAEFASPRIVVIPNGVDMKGSVLVRECGSSLVEATDDRGLMTEAGKNGQKLKYASGNNDDKKNANRTRTVLYLGRLHPLKGLDLLADAWTRVAPAFPEWRLLIIGPDEQGMLKNLKAQACRLGVDDSVTFAEALYGEEKAQAMSAADLFVLPTRSENFGIVVAEALACGVPVITTKGAPWSELIGDTASVAEWQDSRVATRADGHPADTQATPAKLAKPASAANGRCGWWVDIGVEPLAEALKEAMGMTDEERRALGENGRKLVSKKYQWGEIARKMTGVYEKCVNARLR